MGYGGDLIWTGVFRALQAQDARPLVVVHTPKLSDLLCGLLYDRSADLRKNAIFRDNPRLRFIPAQPKGMLSRGLDFGLRATLKVLSLRPAYERAIARLASRRAAAGGQQLLHVDMVGLGYVAEEKSDRLIWKNGGHAIAIMARGMGAPDMPVRPELRIEDTERRRAREVLAAAGVGGPYVVFEPDTNRDWFGELRAWPSERWSALIVALAAERPDLPFVQVGIAGAPLVPGAVDLRGKTSFREAAAVVEGCALFIGTEGGLMHAARAVDAPALILWGGVTLPEFAGYPDTHDIICHRVSCAPCGQRGWCRNDHICMQSITIDEVRAAALNKLAAAPQFGT